MHLERTDGAPVVAPRDFPTNQGGLCRKGWTSTALLQHPERLLHWSNSACVNRLTNPALDPISKMPEFKVCAVRLEKTHEVSHA